MSSHHREKIFTFSLFFLLFFLLYPYEKIDVCWTYCGNHFIIHVDQTIRLYTLNLYCDACQLFLHKTGVCFFQYALQTASSSHSAISPGIVPALLSTRVALWDHSSAPFMSYLSCDEVMKEGSYLLPAWKTFLWLSFQAEIDSPSSRNMNVIYAFWLILLRVHLRSSAHLHPL